MSNILNELNKRDLTVETCIFQLVKMAVRQKASAIAVRFDCKQRKIQVVDNSRGYTKDQLGTILSKNAVEEQDIFAKLRCASYAVVVTSKHEFSNDTYVKVANKFRDKLIQGYSRPSKGTTVSIYNFISPNWTEGDKNHSVSYLLAALAFIELKVSFSLRNDNEQKIIFSVGRPHSPWSVSKQIMANQNSEQASESVSQVVKNGKIDYVTDSYQTSKETTCSDLPNNFSILPNDKNNAVLNNNIHSPLSVWSDWSYRPQVVYQNINVDSNIFFSSNKRIDTSNDACINLSQLSVWSDWLYCPEKPNFNNTKRDQPYKLPPISNNVYKPKLAECRISSNTINSLQIIKQINKEFIAAVANDNGKRLVILIDQHAIHERIRYEWLIEAYRETGKHTYKSERLCKDLLITEFDSNLLKLICLYPEVTMQVGIHVKRIVSPNACLVDAVPTCFLRRKRIYKDNDSMYRLKKNVKLLLLEVAKGLSHSVLPPILPITINNVIASEACHGDFSGSIKFGDPLNIKECILLIQALQDTKAPTRCAHGRPSIIPLLDLKDIEKQNCLKNVRKNSIYFRQLLLDL